MQIGLFLRLNIFFFIMDVPPLLFYIDTAAPFIASILLNESSAEKVTFLSGFFIKSYPTLFILCYTTLVGKQRFFFLPDRYLLFGEKTAKRIEG